MSSYWSCVGPLPNITGSLLRRWQCEDRHGLGECHVKKIHKPRNARDWQQTARSWEQARKGSRRGLRGSVFLLAPWCQMGASKTVRLRVSVVLRSHLTCGILLHQPRETRVCGNYQNYPGHFRAGKAGRGVILIKRSWSWAVYFCEVSASGLKKS